jgi:SAM-dependent methyltransferase
METLIRRRFQGVTNIIRFNWHFYALAIALIALLSLSHFFFLKEYFSGVNFLIALIFFSTAISLLVSYYIYDYSNLYAFEWLNSLRIKNKNTIANINAGFDETSIIIRNLFPDSSLTVFDFYNPKNHTEVSIERARNAYPPYPGTQAIATSRVPLEDNSTDLIFTIFSIHEIRQRKERIVFLNQLNEKLKPDGVCIMVEHLRDIPNFIAYNVGFLHFYSRFEWRNNFDEAGFVIDQEMKVTPFVSVFILKKSNGNTL